MAESTATNESQELDLSNWYDGILRHASAYAERAVSPTWGADTTRLNILLLTTSVVLAFSLAGIPLKGAGLVGLAGSINKVALHIVATILLIYALPGYILAALRDRAARELLLAEPREKFLAGMRAFQEWIKARETEKGRDPLDRLHGEERARATRYKDLMADYEVGDERWLELDALKSIEDTECQSLIRAVLAGRDVDLAVAKKAYDKINDLQTHLGNIFKRERWSRKWHYRVEFFGAIAVGLFALAWSLLAFLLLARVSHTVAR